MTARCQSYYGKLTAYQAAGDVSDLPVKMAANLTLLEEVCQPVHDMLEGAGTFQYECGLQLGCVQPNQLSDIYVTTICQKKPHGRRNSHLDLGIQLTFYCVYE